MVLVVVVSPSPLLLSHHDPSTRHVNLPTSSGPSGSNSLAELNSTSSSIPAPFPSGLETGLQATRLESASRSGQRLPLPRLVRNPRWPPCLFRARPSLSSCLKMTLEKRMNCSLSSPITSESQHGSPPSRPTSPPSNPRSQLTLSPPSTGLPTTLPFPPTLDHLHARPTLIPPSSPTRRVSTPSPPPTLPSQRCLVGNGPVPPRSSLTTPRTR